MDILDKIDIFLDEGDSNADAAIMSKTFTDGRARGGAAMGKGWRKKKKGTANSQEEAPK